MVDRVGRVVIPKPIHKAAGLKAKQKIKVQLTKIIIKIKPIQPTVQLQTRPGRLPVLEINKKAKPVTNENVRAALAAVKSGNADAAIVYRSDSPGVILEGPPLIVYPAAVLRESTSKSDAERFVNYLTSAAAKKIFEKYGFITKW